MASYEKHRREAPKTVRIGVIVASTSRYRDALKGIEIDDESGSKAVSMIREEGHIITSKKIVDDDIKLIRVELLRSLFDEDADSVILIGGTGLSSRDLSIEAIRPLFDKEMEGFSEIFRMVSYQKIGTPAYLTRATAGTIQGRIIFILPGSPNAVETGLDLILPELPHSLQIART